MSSSKKDRMFARSHKVSRLDLDGMILEAAEAETRQQAHPIEIVSVDWIIEDETIQVRVGGLHQPTVKTYAEILRAGGDLPPVDLFRDHDDRLYMGDGFHRLAAHRALGHTEIEAIIWPGGYEAAYQHAEESNLTHGRPLSRKDKFHLFERRVTRGHTWSDGNSNQAIGKSLGVTDRTISNWWGQVEDAYPDNKYVVHHQKQVLGVDGVVRRTRKLRTKKAMSPEIKKQRRIIHNLRNAIHNLRELGLDLEADELEHLTNDLAASFE